MPKDEDGCPYLPKPRLIQTLEEFEVKHVNNSTNKFQRLMVR